jgi:hypothetical protein
MFTKFADLFPKEKKVLDEEINNNRIQDIEKEINILENKNTSIDKKMEKLDKEVAATKELYALYKSKNVDISYNDTKMIIKNKKIQFQAEYIKNTSTIKSLNEEKQKLSVEFYLNEFLKDEPKEVEEIKPNNDNWTELNSEPLTNLNNQESTENCEKKDIDISDLLFNEYNEFSEFVNNKRDKFIKFITDEYNEFINKIANEDMNTFNEYNTFLNFKTDKYNDFLRFRDEKYTEYSRFRNVIMDKTEYLKLKNDDVYQRRKERKYHEFLEYDNHIYMTFSKFKDETYNEFVNFRKGDIKLGPKSVVKPKPVDESEDFKNNLSDRLFNETLFPEEQINDIIANLKEDTVITIKNGIVHIDDIKVEPKSIVKPFEKE